MSEDYGEFPGREDEPMTNQDKRSDGALSNATRAEKIISSKECTGVGDATALSILIIKHIDEAVREAISQELCLGEVKSHEAFNEGFASARDKAARIAMTHFEQTEYHDDTTCNCGSVIAERIQGREADK